MREHAEEAPEAIAFSRTVQLDCFGRFLGMLTHAARPPETVCPRRLRWLS
jgi:hypothetical protein